MWILGGHGGTYKPVWGSENHWAWRLRPPVRVKAWHTGVGVGRMGAGRGPWGSGRGRGSWQGAQGAGRGCQKLWKLLCEAQTCSSVRLAGSLGGGSVLVAGTCH